MNYFAKLNAISVIYGFVIFIFIEIQFNYYRVERIIGWDGDTLDTVFLWLHIIGFILFSILFFFLARNYLEQMSQFVVFVSKATDLLGGTSNRSPRSFRWDE
ncbi:hypothetical protein [Virgibacillus ainsalahensis]